MKEQTPLQTIITDRADSLIHDIQRHGTILSKAEQIEIQLHLVELSRDIGNWAVDEMKENL